MRDQTFKSFPTPAQMPAFRPALRHGSPFYTASGQRFYPLDPRKEEIHLVDIACALAKTCRWGGHFYGEATYSVARHSVLVALSLPHHLRPQGLLHDAHEAYLVDVPRPVKRYLVNYEVLAARLDACIGDRFGVELCDLPSEVEDADDRALVTEARDLRPGIPTEGLPTCNPWLARITPWTVQQAHENFFKLAMQLGLW